MQISQFNDNPIIKDFNPNSITKGVHYGTSFKFTYENVIYDLDVYGELTELAGGSIQINNTLFKVNSNDGFNFIIN